MKLEETTENRYPLRASLTDDAKQIYGPQEAKTVLQQMPYLYWVLQCFTSCPIFCPQVMQIAAPKQVS
jgi:hypothetical protein